jgi:hypothetical protein
MPSFNQDLQESEADATQVRDETPSAATRHHTFSCLAEVSADVDMLMALFRACGPARCSCRTLPALAKGIPLEMHFPDGATVETVASRIRMVADSHVMLQTLEAVPVTENSMHRDWNRN